LFESKEINLRVREWRECVGLINNCKGNKMKYMTRVGDVDTPLSSDAMVKIISLFSTGKEKVGNTEENAAMEEAV
jgi:hypothetical protein